jgi:rhodanese-related sulfurtransferase
MKKLFLFVSLAASVCVWQQGSFAQQAAAPAAAKPFKELHRADLDALLATPEKVLIVDVRSPGEIAFNGAFPVYLSVQTDEGDTKALGIEKHLAEIPKGRTIITVSGRANRSGYAAAVLASKGFNVAGAVGAKTYEEEGGKLEKFKPYTHWSMNGGTPPPRGAFAARDEPKAYKEVKKAEMDGLLAAPEKVLILDIRAPGEIAYWGGLPVYLNIQAAEGDTKASGIEAHLAEIPKDKPIVTVSGRANRSGFAASLLASKGFNALGGFGAMTYGEEGGKLVKYPPYKPPTPKVEK